MKIAYVILHYLAEKDTIECAESILRSTTASQHETQIVIVDNGSPNDSFLLIQEKLVHVSGIHLLHSNQNLGFARGNNLGFQYAKEKLQSDFIVMLNNDTVLSQMDFNEVLVQKFADYRYAVLGPDIVTKDGCHQNPVERVNWTFKKLTVFRMKKRLQLLLSYIPCMDPFLTINQGAYSKNKITVEVLDTQLHGACLIFSPVFIRQFDGLCDQTFLYMEEDILRLQADHYGMLMLYSPDLNIYHKEDIATNMVSVKSIEKKRRIYRNLLKSSGVYSKLKRSYTLIDKN